MTEIDARYHVYTAITRSLGVKGGSLKASELREADVA